MQCVGYRAYGYNNDQLMKLLSMIEPGWFIAALTLISAIVSAAVSVATRPSRKDVNEMIDIKVNARFDILEKEVAEVKKDVKTLLQRTAVKSKTK